MKRKYLLAGLLTVIPLWITWLVVSFIFRLVISAGMPVVVWLSGLIHADHPTIVSVINSAVFKNVFAAILIILFLYFLGWLTTLVLGRRIIKTAEKLMDKIPMVRTVYGGSKRILESFQARPDKQQSVVLINYPSPEMKTVGLVTRVVIDEHTGERLAAVYVPTTPNPTSGFLEIVPYKDIILTNWSVNEALSFIVSGGVVGPEKLNYSVSATPDDRDNPD